MPTRAWVRIAIASLIAVRFVSAINAEAPRGSITIKGARAAARDDGRNDQFPKRPLNMPLPAAYVVFRSFTTKSRRAGTLAVAGADRADSAMSRIISA